MDGVADFLGITPRPYLSIDLIPIISSAKL